MARLEEAGISVAKHQLVKMLSDARVHTANLIPTRGVEDPTTRVFYPGVPVLKCIVGGNLRCPTSNQALLSSIQSLLPEEAGTTHAAFVSGDDVLEKYEARC